MNKVRKSYSQKKYLKLGSLWKWKKRLGNAQTIEFKGRCIWGKRLTRKPRGDLWNLSTHHHHHHCTWLDPTIVLFLFLINYYHIIMFCWQRDIGTSPSSLLPCPLPYSIIFFMWVSYMLAKAAERYIRNAGPPPTAVIFNYYILWYSFYT